VYSILLADMPFGYFNHLSAARKKVYLRSDAIDRLALPPGPSLQDVLKRIQEYLSAEQRAALEKASQQLLDELTRRFDVPLVKVRIRNVRPSGNWGELHGLYEPAEQTPAVISTWMRTVARRQVVAYKTFVRTLLHEFCHHIDYELIKLPETFHTEGFYKREAALFREIHGGALPLEK
jgi:hypothetical protein